jgi:nucleoid DNA-binding protein
LALSFTFHGCAKLVIKRKKARKAGMGVNPFTGEKIKLKAKPACNVARGRALKALKDAVA